MRPAVWLAEGLGLGRVPFAPGTFGTLLGIPLYWLLATWLPWPAYLALIAVTLPASAWICARGAAAYGEPDPSPVVWDEVIGLLVALTATRPGLWPVVVGFIAFRAFDILKPFPVGWLERRFSGGWGILLDDVAAGLYALLVVQLVLAYLVD